MPTNAVTERDAWLAQVVEEPLEPALPIIDPHHHLWDHPGSRYLLDEILHDTGSGHRVIATVFVECMSMYRADGDPAMKPVGETEFVNGIAAQSASGGYGDTRIAAGIVSFADLSLGAAVEPVLRAHIAAAPARFRGIRHAGGFDASPEIRNSHTNPPAGLYKSPRFREGFGQLAKLGLVFDAWQYHPQMPELTELGARVSRHKDHSGSLRRSAWTRSLRGSSARGLRSMEARHRGACAMPQRRRQAWRNQHAGQRIRMA